MCHMVSKLWKLFFFFLAPSFLQNFPSHKVKHLSPSEDDTPLTSSHSGEARYRGKQKTKPGFFPLDVRVTMIFCYCFCLSKNRWTIFSYNSITPLSVPDLFFEGLLSTRHVLNSAEPVGSET